MKRLISIVLFNLTLFLGASLRAEGKEAKTAVANCGAETVQCSATVNAMGDAVMIDVTKLKITDLGTINADKKVDIALPTTVGSTTAYRFTPSTGESKDVATLVVFENVKQAPGTRLFGKTLIRISRHFEPIKEGSPWIEVGRIEIDGKEVEQKEVPVTFKPDGSAVANDPTTKEPMVFPVAKKDLGQ